MRLVTVAGAALCLSACATTSFAPPIVKMDHELTFTRQQTSFNAVCTPDPNAKGTQEILPGTVDGALRLINNFVLTYRCQADRAAEGRQFFEVPSLLSVIGTTTAVALGAGPNVAIAGGAASAGLAQGNSYWAPRQKAGVLNAALDAYLCIQTEAVGIDAYTLRAVGEAQAASTPPKTEAIVQPGKPGLTTVASITVTSERQYFEMVRSALFATERVTAQRLSDAGKPYDAAGVLAEMKLLTAQEKSPASTEAPAAQETAGGDLKTQTGTPTDASGKGLTPAQLNSMALAPGLNKLAGISNQKVGETVLRLQDLQPRLAQCVLRAKI